MPTVRATNPEADCTSPLILERILARRWSKSVRTLQRWRRLRYGPPHLQIGVTIFYRIDDITAFENAAMQDRGRKS